MKFIKSLPNVLDVTVKKKVSVFTIAERKTWHFLCISFTFHRNHQLEISVVPCKRFNFVLFGVYERKHSSDMFLQSSLLVKKTQFLILGEMRLSDYSFSSL